MFVKISRKQLVIVKLVNQFLSVTGANIRKRHLCTSINRDFKEIEIPVPWGSIFGKWFGPYNKISILAIHGWQDNCGTFDRLISLLPHDVSILAIDLPGHGLSSHMPPGMSYKGIDVVITIKRIMNSLQSSKITLMGHSMGAIYSYVYSILYPETIRNLILFDGLYPMILPHEIQGDIDNAAQIIDRFLDYDEKSNNDKSKSLFTINQMQELIYKGTKKEVPLEMCHYLLKRSVRQLLTDPTKYYFTKDLRLRVMHSSLIVDNILMQASRGVTCPICLLISSNERSLLSNDATFWELVKVIRNQNQDIEYHLVEGNHHLHLNNPEALKGVLIEFLRKHNV